MKKFILLILVVILSLLLGSTTFAQENKNAEDSEIFGKLQHDNQSIDHGSIALGEAGLGIGVYSIFEGIYSSKKNKAVSKGFKNVKGAKKYKVFGGILAGALIVDAGIRAFVALGTEKNPGAVPTWKIIKHVGKKTVEHFDENAEYYEQSIVDEQNAGIGIYR